MISLIYLPNKYVLGLEPVANQLVELCLVVLARNLGSAGGVSKLLIVCENLRFVCI
jgi:hypothetical protein